MQVVAICSAQVPASGRISFEFLAFASNAIFKKTDTLYHAVSQLGLPFPQNNSNFGKGSDNPFK